MAKKKDKITLAQEQVDADTEAFRNLGTFSSPGTHIIERGIEGLAGLGEFRSDNIANYENAIRNYENMGKFTYNLAGDPLFNQYKDSYTQMGRTAMQDTMGQAAALTGGYGNSYATAAGQQAYNSYMSELNNRIPELYNLALQNYNTEAARLQSLAGLYGDAVNQDLNVYNTNANHYNSLINAGGTRVNADAAVYNANAEYLANMLGISTKTLQYLQNIEYQRERDAVADEQWQKKFDYNASQDSIANGYTNRQITLKENKYAASLLGQNSSGVNPKVFSYGTGRTTRSDVKNGNITYTDANGNSLTVKAGYNPFLSNNINPDVLDENGDYDPSKAFDNGYQPNNITYNGQNYKLKVLRDEGTGEPIYVQGETGYDYKVFDVDASKGIYAVWNPLRNEYDLLTKKTTRKGTSYVPLNS